MDHILLATIDPTAVPTVISQAPTTSREAQVQSVEIQTLKADPPQINAIVRGNLTKSCAKLGQTQIEVKSNTFQITIYAVSPTDQGCVQTITPFETTIALNTKGLVEGTYTVIVNGVRAVFTVPNSVATPIPTTAIPTSTPITPTPTTSAPTSTSIPTEAACIDSAAFVADVTIPDYSVVAPNTPFTKTWRLKNTGSCTWNSSYLVAYLSGTTMT